MPWLSAFTAAAGRYWLSVFWTVDREVRSWECRARTIPDSSLRRLALTALSSERGNLEGAAAFAAFLPAAHRAAAVRASVAFQTAYDYADALSEQPSANPIDNARCLHSALPAALGIYQTDADYYRYYPNCGDGGYLESLRGACWRVVRKLPAVASVAGALQAAGHRIQIYQSLNLSESHGGRVALARWARMSTPNGGSLQWWETAAAAGSSLLVFALIAAAAEPSLNPRQASALTSAYFPWIGALHTLLDSVVDQSEDVRTGHRSLLDYYRSPQEAAQRIGAIATEAARRAQALPGGLRHRMILAAMTSFYLSATPASSPYAQLVRPRVLTAMGELARPTMLIMSARQKAAQLRSAGSPPCAHR
jgi:tetraprenyl-beta-curcumene synthase